MDNQPDGPEGKGIKLPHMPLWVYDIDTDRDCRRMPDATFGRYMRLLIRQWIEGSVPAELANAPRIIRQASAELAARRTHMVEARSWFYGRDERPRDRRRRDRVRVAGYISPRLRQSTYERDGFRCRTCGSPDRLSIDHVRPISRGGLTKPGNLQTLCVPCNARKGAR